MRKNYPWPRHIFWYYEADDRYDSFLESIGGEEAFIELIKTKCMRTVTPRCTEIYFECVNTNDSYRVIGERYGVTTERVRQIYWRACQKIKKSGALFAAVQQWRRTSVDESSGSRRKSVKVVRVPLHEVFEAYAAYNPNSMLASPTKLPAILNGLNESHIYYVDEFLVKMPHWFSWYTGLNKKPYIEAIKALDYSGYMVEHYKDYINANVKPGTF